MSNISKEYFDKLALTMPEKVSFYTHFGKAPKVIIDLGCARGDLCKYLRSIWSGDEPFRYIGYDRTAVIEQAKENLKDEPYVALTSDFKDLMFLVQNNSEDNLLVLNSVMHEVFSEGQDEVSEFFYIIRSVNPKQVFVRDMFLTANKPPSKIDMKAIWDQTKFICQLYKKARKNPPLMDDNKQIIEAYFKSFHLSNYDYEKGERYFSTDLDQVINNFKIIGLDNLVIEYYTPDFFKEKFRETGINWHKTLNQPIYNTHFKLLMERRKEVFKPINFRRKHLQGYEV